MFAAFDSWMKLWRGPTAALVFWSLATPAQPPPAVLAGVPLFFEADNPESPRQFLARAPVAQFLIAPTEVQMALTRFEQGSPVDPLKRGWSGLIHSGSTYLARLTFVGANRDAHIQGSGAMPGRVNYLIGNDSSRWRTGLPMFAQVQVTNLYRGIDLLYYGNPRQLEYDFRVAPGADPGVIALSFQGVDELATNLQGDLVLRIGAGEVRQHRPVLYQVINGVRHEIAGGYQILANHTAAFAVGSYDRRFPLTIDPMFDYSSYFGGNGNDAVLAIKVDAVGNIYIAGQTLSTVFPFAIPGSAFQRTFSGGSANGDAFVAKLNSAGNQLLYFTYLGSSGEDGALDLAIDSAGNAYVTGFTDSSGFPVYQAVFPTIHGTVDPNLGLYPNDAFVAELNTNGSALVFSTYFGGSGTDIGSGIAVDPAGNVYITGYTYSIDLPTSTNSFQRYLFGTDDAFVAKFAPSGSRLIYATYLGGISFDVGEGIAADSQGCAYVTGSTASPGFPVTPNAWQTNLNNSTNGLSGYDAFVTKVDAWGSNLVYSTFVGGSYSDYGYRIALDAQNNAFVTGTTLSTDFPQTGSVFGLNIGNKETNALNYDAFLVRLDSAGRLVYSTIFGGTNTDVGWDVAVDSAGRAFVIGTTFSSDFPVYAPFGLFASAPPSGTNVFVTAFNTNGDAVRYSGYLGGSAPSYGYGIAVDSESSAYISGLTYALNFPITPAPFQSAPYGRAEGFIAKIRLLDPNLTATLSGSNLVVRWPASAPQYFLQAASGMSPPITWTTIAQTPVLTNGFYMITLDPTNDFRFFRLQRQ